MLRPWPGHPFVQSVSHSTRILLSTYNMPDYSRSWKTGLCPTIHHGSLLRVLLHSYSQGFHYRSLPILRDTGCKASTGLGSDTDSGHLPHWCQALRRHRRAGQHSVNGASSQNQQQLTLQ